MTTPTTRPPLTAGESRLLRRLKLALWLVTVLFLIHGMAVQFPEVFPITRWSMFSQARNGPKELQEGYLIYYEIASTDITGETRVIPHEQLYASLPISTARATLAFVAIHYASQTEEPDLQTEYAAGVLERLAAIHGQPIEHAEIRRLYYAIDYESFPYVDFTTPSQTEIVATLMGDGRVLVAENSGGVQ